MSDELNIKVDGASGMDVLEMDEERIIDEVTNLATHYGADVLVLTPEDYRIMALEELTLASQGGNDILSVIDGLGDAVQYNYIARVLQRALDLNLDVQELVDPPALSLEEIINDTPEPQFKIGDEVWHVVTDEVEGVGCKMEAKVIVIGIYRLNLQTKYKIGNMAEDGDTIYPMGEMVPEDELSFEKPAVAVAKRPSFLRVVK